MRRTLVTLLALGAIVLAGCGDGEGDVQEQDTGPAPTAPATPTQPPEVEVEEEQTEAAESEQRTYRVRSGDTLSAIAERFDTTVRALARANDIDNPNEIRAGERLVIPTDD